MTELRRHLGIAAVVGLMWTLASPGVASADEDELVVKRMRFAERSGRLVVTTSFPELFDATAARALDNGLPATVVVRAYVYRGAEELPVSLVFANVKIVYDLWDEVYTVRVQGPGGSTTRRYRKRSAAIKAASRLLRFPVSRLAQIAIGPHYFMAMVVELNPVSPELLAEVRRWLGRPAGDKTIDASSSFFGSFVSVFSNPKLPDADAVLRIRSQPFYRVKRN